MAEVFTPRTVDSGLGSVGKRGHPNSDSFGNSSSSSFPTAEPNPPFVFPMLSETTSSNRPPIEQRLAEINSRPVSRHRPQKLSIHALPAFEFGSSPSRSPKAEQPSPSPTRSLARTTPPINSASGHRRGGSEFVGGSAVNPIITSTSPDVAEEVVLSPPSLTSPPVAPRRGHAHRRSGALSQHDLSMILKPSSQVNVGSAPNTPSNPEYQKFLRPEIGRASSEQSYLANPRFENEAAAVADNSAIAETRARVTFRGEPEYIPRPLSTISSETSSSMSTIRPGHSVSNSITSFASGGASSPPSAKRNKSDGFSMSPGLLEAPNCALTVPNSQVLPEQSAPDQSQPTTGLNSSMFSNGVNQRRRLASRSVGHLVEKTSNENESSNGLEQKTTSVAPESGAISISQYPSNFEESLESLSPRPKTSPGEQNVPRRNTKAKSFADFLLAKKSKQMSHDQALSVHRHQEHQSAEIPPSNFSLEDVTFDDDTTCIIENAAGPPGPALTAPMQYPHWNAQDIELAFEDSSPMLDIDAAFSTPDRRMAYGRSPDVLGNAPLHKRRLHSSGETGGFSGPGMHYHRRTESAPELDAFEQSRLGFGHRSSNPAMAEAIEEEEEDDGENSEPEKPHDIVEATPGQDHNLGIHVVESGSLGPRSIRSRRQMHMHRPPTEKAAAVLEYSGFQEASDEVEIVDAEEEPRFSVITKSSDDSSITPTVSPDPSALQITSIALNLGDSPEGSLATPRTPNTIPSPVFSKSSFDTSDLPRIHTAHSSITDRTTLNSSRAGDLGLSSVDDVPSLTSSASTMISGRPPRFSSGANTTNSAVEPAERSFSLAADVPTRTRVRSGSSSKRASLVSLSRLVGSTYNRSKLNIAELAAPDSPEKPEKKKVKRMSRLMFWKSKDKLAAA